MSSCCSSNLISCNFSALQSSELKHPKPSNSLQTNSLLKKTTTIFGISISLNKAPIFTCNQIGRPKIYQRALESKNSEDPVLDNNNESSNARIRASDVSGWTTSVLLFGLWAALVYYAFKLSANQTPIRDVYFLKKLLFLKGDDGFRMNQVLVALWNLMGIWPLVYAQLLLPSGRSANSKIVVWPFIILSFFGGAYALIPYFVLWKPPPPPIKEDELKRWPLNFLESKITATVSLAAGLGLLIYGGMASGDDWKEFFQYFRESRLVHVTSLDFTLLSSLAPFWVYNDITARRGLNKGGSWLVPLSYIPFLGPALYILLRPPIQTLPSSLSSTDSDPK